MDIKLDDTRIPDLIMAVCSPEYKDDTLDTDKTQDSDKAIKEEHMVENITTSTVEREVEKQTIEPERKRTGDRHIKSAKEVQAEMLQRRLKSLRAALGEKVKFSKIYF